MQAKSLFVRTHRPEKSKNTPCSDFNYSFWMMRQDRLINNHRGILRAMLLACLGRKRSLRYSLDLGWRENKWLRKKHLHRPQKTLINIKCAFKLHEEVEEISYQM